jgi:hypothetical protein
LQFSSKDYAPEDIISGIAVGIFIRRCNMVIGKKQGIGILILGLLFLTGGILVLITVPSWGNWIAGYPAEVLQKQIPAQAAPTVQAMLGIIFGPLLSQVGEYIRIAGYFVGSLFSLIALAITSVGITLVTKK